MDYFVAAGTDIGIKKRVNQDRLSVKVIETARGKIVFAVICDGMGGLEKGEWASAAVVEAFMDWVDHELPSLCHRSPAAINNKVIRAHWMSIVANQNDWLQDYGRRHGMSLGTTVTALLLTDTLYYVINVGDSRVYELTTGLVQITRDQTVVAREVSLGRLTSEQAEHDSRRHVLLQCVGATGDVRPEMHIGKTKKKAVYMLCSDGFRHKITPQELYAALNPQRLADPGVMQKSVDYLIEVNKERQETDNISVILVRSY